MKIKRNIKSVLFTLSLLALYSCSTSREIAIKSTPDNADVFLKIMGKDKVEKIGQTPLVLNNELISKYIVDEDTPTMFIIKRKGYLKQQLIMNNIGRNSADYHLNLEENNVAHLISKIDAIGPELFEAQRLMRSGSYDNSLKLLEKLNDEYPYSSIVNELKGAAYYLKKDYTNSLVYYDIAVKYNQKNIDAYKMKKYLEVELGVKRPLAKRKDIK